MRNLEEHIFFGFEHLVFTTDLNKERYSAKYSSEVLVCKN